MSKKIKLISIIIAVTIMWQGTVFARPALFYSLRPLAAGEGKSRAAVEDTPGSEGRPRAKVERSAESQIPPASFDEEKAREDLLHMLKNVGIIEDPKMANFRHNVMKVLGDTSPPKIDTYIELRAEHNRFMQGSPKQQAASRTLGLAKNDVIAYFSLEYGTSNRLRIFGGGLGILSGDTLKGASDRYAKDTFVAVGLAYQEGFFEQHIVTENDHMEERYLNVEVGSQIEIYKHVPLQQYGDLVKVKDPSDGKERDLVIEVEALPGKFIYAKVWRAMVGRVELYLLDTNINENDPSDKIVPFARGLTANLYARGKDSSSGEFVEPQWDSWRFCQEMLLGIGGARALEAMGLNIAVLHMNESHSVFAGIELITQELKRRAASHGISIESLKDVDPAVCERLGLTFESAAKAVKNRIGFTTHTPIDAGNEQYEIGLFKEHFENYANINGIKIDDILALFEHHSRRFNRPMVCMADTAMKMAGVKNAVSKRHAQVSQGLYHNGAEIIPITNAVHRRTWQSPHMQNLLEAQSGLSSDDLDELNADEIGRLLSSIDNNRFLKVRRMAKESAVSNLKRLRPQSNLEGLDKDAFTIVVARRATPYKRLELVLGRIATLREKAKELGIDVQIIFACKAHPADWPGKQIIKRINDFIRSGANQGDVFFVENYDIDIAKSLIQVADVWLNNPRPPLEASQTSGQKAALCGTLTVSSTDGWPLEAENAWDEERGVPKLLEFITGAAVLFQEGTHQQEEQRDEETRVNMYAVLAQLMEIYKNDTNKWAGLCKNAVYDAMAHFTMIRFGKDYEDLMYRPLIQASRTPEMLNSLPLSNLTAPAEELQSSILRPQAFGEMESRAAIDSSGSEGRPQAAADRLAKPPIRSAQPVPDENELLKYTDPKWGSWDARIRVSGKVDTNTLPAIFNVKMTPQEKGKLAAAVKDVFKGDIYRIEEKDDHLLLGRRFWYSEATGTLYITRSAFTQIGLTNIVGFLTNIQKAIDRGYVGYIKRIEFPRQVKPLMVVKKTPEIKQVDKIEDVGLVASAAQPATSKPISPAAPTLLSETNAAAATPAAPAPKSPPKTEAGDHKTLWRNMEATTRIALGSKMLPNVTGSTTLGEEVLVWIDVSDSKKPGFNFVELELPLMHRCYTPLMPDPRIAAPPGSHRYKATISLTKLNDALQDNNANPDFVALRNQIKVDLDKELLIYPADRRQRWLAKTIPLIGRVLATSGNFERVRQRYPAQVENILNFIRRRYNEHQELNKKAQEAKQYLRGHSERGEVNKETIVHVIDSMDAALAPWPYLQIHARHLKTSFGIDAKKTLDECLTLFGITIPSEAHLMDIMDLYGMAPADILAEVYYDACRYAWSEKLSPKATAASIKVPLPAGDDDMCEVYRLGQWASILKWEASFSDEAKANLQPIESDEPVSLWHIGVTGVLLLDARGQPRQFIPGGGAVVPTHGLGAYFSPYTLAEWYRPGDRIVLVFPSLTNDANYEQISDYAKGWLMLQKMLSGSPEVWLGTQSLLDGGLTFFRPAAPNDMNCWNRLTTKVMDKQTAWEKFSDFLDKKVYLAPNIDIVELERVAKKASKKKHYRPVARPKLSGKTTQTISTSQPDETLDIIDAAKAEYRRLEEIARALPKILREGLRECFGADLANRIMDLVAHEHNLGPDFKALGKNPLDKSIPSLYKDIRLLAQDAQLFIAERLSMDILDDKEIFERVEVEGLSELILSDRPTEDAAAKTAETAADEELETKVDLAIKDLKKRCPEIFSPERMQLVEPFARDWVRQRLAAGQTASHAAFKKVWEGPELQMAQEAEKNHAAVIQEAQDALNEISQVAQLTMPDSIEFVPDALTKASAALSKLDPIRDALLIKSLEDARVNLAAALATKTVAYIKTMSPVDQKGDAATQLISQAKQIISGFTEAIKVFTDFDELRKLSLEKIKAEALLAKAKDALVSDKLENKQIVETLHGILSGKAKPEKVGKLANRMKNIKDRGSFNERQFYGAFIELAEEYVKYAPPAITPPAGKAELLSSILRPRAAADRKDAAALSKEAQLLMAVGQNRTAKKILLRAMGLDSSNPDVLIKLAEVCRKLGEYEEALMYIDSAIKLNPKGLGALQLAFQQLKEKLQKVLEYRTEARSTSLTSTPERGSNPRVRELNRQAGGLIRDKRYEEAKKVLREALKLDRHNVNMLVNLAKICEIMREYWKAIEYADRAINLEAKMSSAYKTKARAQVALGYDQDAIETYNKGIRRCPKDSSLLVGLAQFFVSRGRYRGAIVCCDQAILRYPHNPEAYLTKANAQELSGDTDGAIKTIKEGRTKCPNIHLVQAERPFATPRPEPLTPATSPDTMSSILRPMATTDRYLIR